MNIRENLKISLEQQETLRDKIYKILDELYFSYEGKIFSSNFELPLYNSDTNLLGSVVIDCVEAIGLPRAFMYQNNPLNKYFEYNPNNILTVAEFVTILIDFLIKYQTQLQKFKDLPKGKQEKCYNKIYKFIEQNLLIKNNPSFPNIIINTGNNKLSKLKARKTIIQSAIIMGLNKKDVYNFFGEENYFQLPTTLESLYLILFLPLILIFHIINLIITKKWDFNFFSYKQVKPITAKDFADIFIELWLMKYID